MDALPIILIIAGLAALVLIGAVVIRRSRNEGVIQVNAAGSTRTQAVTSSYTPVELDEMAMAGKLVEIIHPLVLRSAEQALAKGGPMTRYVVRYQQKVWITFEPLPDPQEREQAYDLFRRLNAGAELDIRAMMALIGKIGR